MIGRARGEVGSQAWFRASVGLRQVPGAEPYGPLAERLTDFVGLWRGATVLDVPTGLGTVARLLADRLGPTGRG